MNLLKYELYKIFSKKLVLIGIALLIALILSSGIQLSHVNNVFKTYNASIKSGKNQILVSQSDYEVLNNTISYPNSWWINHKKQLSILKNDLTKLKNKNGINNYAYKEEELKYNYLKAMKAPAAKSYSALWLYIFNHYYTYTLAAFLIIVGISPIFSEEYSTNVDALILSSKKGRTPIVRAKVLAALAFIIIIAVTSCILQLLLGIGMLGNGNWNNPVQISINFENVGYPLCMTSYFVIQFFTNLAATIALGLFVLFISVKTSNLIVPTFAGVIAVILIEILQYIQAIAPQWLNSILDFYYIKYIYSDCLYQTFKAFNVFGIPVLYPYWGWIVMLVASVCCILLTKHTFIKHSILS